MKTIRLLLTVAVLLTTALGAASAEPVSAYSATIVVTRHGQVSNTKQYVDRGKVRSEMGDGAQRIVTIERPDKKVTWTLLMAQKMYMEYPLDGTRQSAVSALPSGATWVKIGTDTLQGVKCEKFRLDFHGKPVGFAWLAYKHILKYESADGQMTAVYSDVKVGPQPAALFELPADFRKVQSQKQ